MKKGKSGVLLRAVSLFSLLGLPTSAITEDLDTPRDILCMKKEKISSNFEVFKSIGHASGLMVIPKNGIIYQGEGKSFFNSDGNFGFISPSKVWLDPEFSRLNNITNWRAVNKKSYEGRVGSVLNQFNDASKRTANLGVSLVRDFPTKNSKNLALTEEISFTLPYIVENGQEPPYSVYAVLVVGGKYIKDFSDLKTDSDRAKDFVNLGGIDYEYQTLSFSLPLPLSTLSEDTATLFLLRDSEEIARFEYAVTNFPKYLASANELVGRRLDFKKSEENLENSNPSGQTINGYECLNVDLSFGLCYLTTAASHTVGLSDDCWELRTLRKYRDEYMAKSSLLAPMIEEYYQIAPKIVSAINARKDATRIWLKTYWLGIVPSAICAQLGLNKIALKLYQGMTSKLSSMIL